MIKHYGLTSSYYNIDENDFVLQAGKKYLQFYTTPYCHSPGAFVTYEPETKVLFSGDIFGGLEDSWHFLADEHYFRHIEGFHMAYMPSRDILNYALRKIESLDIDLIAPQHGSIIQRKYIAELIEKMKQMECGLYIDRKYSQDLMRTIEKLNNLQTEFEVSLDEIKHLKRGQDGDYFLTTLLMKPLMNELNQSGKITTDCVLIQKKAFLFKEKFHHLGGDFNMTGELNFRGQNYVMFFNGDGMGKSMQGAGGALVLGAVFEALIERTQLSGEAQRQFPERWLKYAFIELHKVFESFDGSMLVSLAVGLIEDDTGLLYSINAEHPFTVIYRGGQARFLEEVTEFRKLGTPGLKGSMYIRTYQLEPGDVLIAGSDGRDDIRIKSDDGNTYIADDETEFLRAVEIADGLLGRIVKHLESRGELTDDLSLLRLAYREDAPPAEIGMSQDVRDLYQKARELFREEKGAESVALLEDAASREGSTPDVLRTLAGTAARIRDYEKAARYGTEYAALRPGDTEFLFLLSYSLRKLGRIGEAADYGERVRLREPDHVPNLMNLARCYVRLGNPKRAQQMAEHALSREPENEALQRLCNQLEQARAASQN